MQKLRSARDLFLATVAVAVALRKLDQAILYFRARIARRETGPERPRLIVIERGVRC